MYLGYRMNLDEILIKQEETIVKEEVEFDSSIISSEINSDAEDNFGTIYLNQSEHVIKKEAIFEEVLINEAILTEQEDVASELTNSEIDCLGVENLNHGENILKNYHTKRISERECIIGLKDSGLSNTVIAKQLGLSTKTVYRWIKRWNAEGNLRDHDRSGKPRSTTADVDARIIETGKANPLTNSIHIKNNLELKVSSYTVRRRLRDHRLNCRVAATKIKLSDSNTEQRLDFANRYVNEGMDFWGRVIFSDEKTFRSSDNGQVRCWHLDNEARIGQVSCNVWGWMYLHGIGELAQFERISSDQYVEILEEVMLPSVRGYALPYPERIIYMHDNSRLHRARVVRNWFEEQSDIELLNWPSRSCDLNPIENIWGTIIKEWEGGEIRTKPALMQHISSQWEYFRLWPENITNLVESMPEKLRNVVAYKGGLSKC